MDLCVEYGVECGSPIIELSQEGRGGGNKVKEEEYIIEYITCRDDSLKFNPLTSPVV